MNALETERLILLPAVTERDEKPFLDMLKNDGDFRIFCGVELTEETLKMFRNYFEKDNNCLYAIFTKEKPDNFIGYAGFSEQNNRCEIEFYISVSHRNNGYCTEAMQKLCRKFFQNKRDDSEKLYATTLQENAAAIRVIEKCGFVRKKEDFVMCFSVCIGSDDTFYMNQTVDYVLTKKISGGNGKETAEIADDN